MSFSILKKKRFKFQVDLMLADLSHVPFVNAVLFAKVRLLDGGNFCETSQRVAVLNHHAVWGKTFNFSCRIASNQQTGILEPCLCRISIRRELKGGKCFHKLGFVDVNLSEFAGSGVDGLTRSYLLDGYNGDCQRQDNSLLRINASMVLQSADPCFKVPPAIHAPLYPHGALNPTERRAIGDDRVSLNSASSGIGSLGRRSKPTAMITQITSEGSTATEFAPGHSRNSSQTSHSQGSGGYCSAGLTHSRQSSSESGHTRRHSSDLTSTSTIHSSVNRLNAPAVKKRIPSTNEVVAVSSSSQSRIDSTRVDAGDLIDALVKDALHDHMQVNMSEEKSGNNSGLQLFISKEDGSATVVGSRDVGSCMKDSMFEQVIIDDFDAHRT